jgi:type II secretory pathway predicted ATPase ExeA
MYLHWTSGSALDLLRQIALELGLEPPHYRGDLVRQISQAIVHLNQSKKQHPILICDEAQLLRHPALELLPLLLNFDMDSSHYRELSASLHTEPGGGLFLPGIPLGSLLPGAGFMAASLERC